jgi:hypothetical protein
MVYKVFCILYFVFEHHFQPNGCHGRPFEVPEVAIEAELENLDET